MRKSFVLFLALVLVTSLSAQSVTISQDQLTELIAILESYGQITTKLEASLTSSETRINSLETGFAEYKRAVEEELLPRAIALERTVFWLQLGLVGATALAVGAGAVAIFR